MEATVSEGSTSEASLLRAIGVWGLAASILNVTVGGGIFRLPAIVAASLGPSAPIAYLLCAVAMGLIVLCIAEAGSRVSLTGGPYAYVEVAFGPFAGFLAGVLLWLVGTLAVAAIAVLFAANAASLFPAFAGSEKVLLLLLFLLLSAVNIVGVREGTALNAVTAVAKLLPLLLLIVAGAFASSRANLAWSGIPPTASLARTSVFLLFAFFGIEGALVPSGEVRDVARTVPRAIAIAMVGVTLLYLALQVVAQGVLGEGLARAQETPLADVAFRVLGPKGRVLLLAGATLSTFGSVGGLILAIPRAVFAFARDGFLPSWIARVHPRFHTPFVAIPLQSAIVLALSVTSTFERLAILANLSTLLLYGMCCIASFELRRRDVRAGGVPFKVPAPGLVPFLALSVILFLLTSIRKEEWAAMGICVLVASAVFLITRPSRARS